MATSHDARNVRLLSVSKRAFHVPAETLEEAVRLCDPFTPLDPREDGVLHEDLNAIRGGDRLGKIVRNIRRAGGCPRSTSSAATWAAARPPSCSG
jgi:hypothetical protein